MTNAEKCRAYYVAHKAERLRKQTAYYRAHQAERLQYAKEYQAAHLDEHRQATERHRRKNPSVTRAYNRAYYRQTVDEQRPRKAAEQRGSGRKPKRIASKISARNAVAYAIKTGKMVKPSVCPKCDRLTPSRRMHGHHTDYSRPLDVTWLCSLCHGEEHQT